MSSFVSTMHEWQRMCGAVQAKNKTTTQSWCTGCPIESYCYFDTSITDATDEDFRVVDERVQRWADANPPIVYPTWEEWLVENGVLVPDIVRLDGSYRFFVNGKPLRNIPSNKMFEQIPREFAEANGIKPKEEER